MCNFVYSLKYKSYSLNFLIQKIMVAYAYKGAEKPDELLILQQLGLNEVKRGSVQCVLY